MTADTTASASSGEPRAFVFLKSRRRLDLLDPDPHAIASPTRPFGGSSTNRDAASAPMQAVTASWTVSTRSPLVKNLITRATLAARRLPTARDVADGVIGRKLAREFSVAAPSLYDIFPIGYSQRGGPFSHADRSIEGSIH